MMVNYVFLLFAFVFGHGLADVIVCEDQSAYIKCPHNSYIQVSEAIYGRLTDSSICPHPSIRTTHCKSWISDQLIKADCNNRNICRVTADHRRFGDPCVGTYKYLEVKYTCV